MLLFVYELGLHMSPPRDDGWAGCVGVVAGILIFCFRNGLGGVAFATVCTGSIGGCGFALAAAIKEIGISSGWVTNWHSVMEQTDGLFFGLALAVAIGVIKKRAPRVSDDPPLRRWTDVRDCIKHGGRIIQQAGSSDRCRAPGYFAWRKLLMEFRIWVEVRLGGRVLSRQVVAQVDREATGIGPEEIGLTLEEGKTVLSQVQAGMIHQQVEAFQAAHWKCRQCGSKQRIKDRRRRCLRTIFGVVRVSCRRYLRCRCQGGKRGTVWPLNGRQVSGTTPELQYLYADWGSKVPYRRAAAVLQELLPGHVSHATLRRHTLKVGSRLQQRVIEPSEYDWPESRREPVPAAKSLSVAIDGTYVRADGTMWLREYQVVGGRLERQGKLGDYFAWVPQHQMCIEEDFMKAALEASGWTPESQVRVLADGADGLANLVGAEAGKPTERVLDWFHISMRLRPIEQMSSKIAMVAGDSDAELKQLLTEKVPRIRYQLWHGKREAALERIAHVRSATKRLEGSGSVDGAERVQRFRRHLSDLRDYLRSNWKGLRNYGAERRQGSKISSALAESAMSHLVNQRMGKRQPMRWSAEGAHLLLQVRCAVLNHRLDDLFREWHPDFRKRRAVPLPLA